MFSRIWRKGKFLNSYWWLGDLTLFEVQAGTTFYYLNCQTNQARVVQTLDSAIHRINHYPADSVIDLRNTYPLDSDLSGG